MEALGRYSGKKRLKKIACRCDKILASNCISAHFAWCGTSTGGGVECWEEYIRNFLAAYERKYKPGYHQKVAVATLLSLAKVYGIFDSSRELQFSSTLNHFCQMGKAGNYAHLPICKIEDDELIEKALKKPAFRCCFAIKVKCCDKADGDPRTAQKTKTMKIKFKI